MGERKQLVVYATANETLETGVEATPDELANELHEARKS